MSTLDVLQAEPKIAYFSMEIGLRSDVPTYSGGLGGLAGDTIKACADSPTGGRLPVLFLDTDFPDNAPEHRELTSFLYGRDAAYRLRQEAVLGLGGGKMPQGLGITGREDHMKEGP